MGAWCSKLCDPDPESGTYRHSLKRLRQWKATGTVSLRDAKLKEIPSPVYDIAPGVRVLDCANNSLKDCDVVSMMKQLTRLVLSRNQLSLLPSDLGTLSQLKVLQLDYNNLTSLPASLGRLHKLEQLSVAHNELAALPTTFSGLEKLRTLNLSGNKLSRVPDTVGTCFALEELLIAGNQITEIPECVGALRILRSIDADNNQVVVVSPVIFKQCVALHTLLLHNNPITMAHLQATGGFSEFETRRASKYSKAIATGVMLGPMDTGVDEHGTQEGRRV